MTPIERTGWWWLWGLAALAGAILFFMQSAHGETVIVESSIRTNRVYVPVEKRRVTTVYKYERKWVDGHLVITVQPIPQQKKK